MIKKTFKRMPGRYKGCGGKPPASHHCRETRAMCSGMELTAASSSRPGTHHSSGQGSTIFQSSSPFLIFFISVVSPPLRRIQSFTVSGQ